MLAHQPQWDSMFFVSHFMDGLREEIRGVVLLHRPKELDTDASLVLLQEEVLDMMKCKEASRTEPIAAVAHSTTRSSYPLLPPPNRPGAQLLAQSEDRRGTEGGRQNKGVPCCVEGVPQGSGPVLHVW